MASVKIVSGPLAWKPVARSFASNVSPSMAANAQGSAAGAKPPPTYNRATKPQAAAVPPGRWNPLLGN